MPMLAETYRDSFETTSGGSSVDLVGMALPGLAPNLSSVSVSASASASEDSAKKIRKPYTITKSRESWSEQEHDKFLEALQLFDRDWKKIEAFVGSKTVIQIRSHAQKYFLKVQKNGTREHVPPPRPKRKASHPYPQKASKNVPVSQQVSPAFPPAATQLDSGYYPRAESSSILTKSGSSCPTVSSWVHHTIPPIDVSFVEKDDGGPPGIATGNNCSSGSTESSHPTWPPCSEIPEKGSETLPVRVKPDFSQVYKFIGSVFDPSTTDHLKKLKEMDPIDLETVLLLMRNLSINLSSPDFEEQKLFLSVYDMNPEDAEPAIANQTDECVAVPGTAAKKPSDLWNDPLRSVHLGSVKGHEKEDQNSQQKSHDLKRSSDSKHSDLDGTSVNGTAASFHGNLAKTNGMTRICFSNEAPT